jgi:hypothetical protein
MTTLNKQELTQLIWSLKVNIRSCEKMTELASPECAEGLREQSADLAALMQKLEALRATGRENDVREWTLQEECW